MKFYKENNINPAVVVPAAARPVPDLHRALLRAQELREARCRRRQPRAGCGLVPTSPTRRRRHWSGYAAARRSTSAASWRRRYFMSRDDGARRSGSCCSILPIVFIPFIINFPVGLVLYWVTTNLWTVGQGLDHAPAGAADAARRPRSGPRARRRRRTRRAGARRPRRTPSRPRPAATPGAAAPREAQEEGGAGGDASPCRSRRPARPSARRSGRRCASSRGSSRGSTRPPCASRSSPRASAGCSVSATRRRAWSRRVDAAPAAEAPPAEPVDESELAADVRERGRADRRAGSACTARIELDGDRRDADRDRASAASSASLIGKHGQTIDAIQYLANADRLARPRRRAQGGRGRRRRLPRRAARRPLEALAMRSAERAIASHAVGRARADDARSSARSSTCG